MANKPLDCEFCRKSFIPTRSKGQRYCSRLCFISARHGTDDDRFWSKVNRNGPIPSHRPELGNCWVWIGNRDSYGYGVFRATSTTKVPSHRRSLLESLGLKDSPLYVLHKCDNPACVRHDHLFLGTYLDNIRDMVAKGRQGIGEANGNAKISPQIVREIRSLAKSGKRQCEIAARFGVDPSNISLILAGKTWAHVA